MEAVTIARELTLRAHRGELPGIPSTTVLRFTDEGDTLCEGPVAAGQSVERAGRLLESLLPGFDAPPEFRVPGALRLVVARSLGTLDLPAYSTLDEFADAMARFGADDMRTVVGGFVRTWRAAVESADVPADGAAETELVTESLELTISDVRRARRATGLRLADIAQRSRIPISLLREFEWGYFINWPANQDGRSQLVRYARAAGLDVEVVMRAVWPVLEQAVRTRAGAPAVVEGAIVEDEPAVPAADTRLVRRQPDRSLETRKKLERRPLWLAALAIPALLAIGFIPAAWQARIDDASAAPASSAAAAPPAARRPIEGSSPSGPNGPGAPSIQTQGRAPNSDASAPSSMTTTPGQLPPAQVLGNVAGARVPVVASQRVSSTEPGPSPDRADL
ncbi:MAG: helix-turn-helix domain-containing protein, partial [Acidobacteriota bacterium]|nr:helix-turn-helix domain-containing protein [Acidobacteriota bacterium]